MGRKTSIEFSTQTWDDLSYIQYRIQQKRGQTRTMRDIVEDLIHKLANKLREEEQ